MSISQHIPDAIKRATRSIGVALWLDNPDTWFGLPVILRARLTERERAALAFMALESLDPDNAVKVAEGVIGGGAGQPQAPLFDYMDQAAFWADMADPEELEAYCLASFNRLSPVAQAAFLNHVNKRAA